ncbi:hypothetical protein CHELA40_50147 [Chelatococcus asaccharovorans]|nr:hypothetical protein CHELA17_20110 [Chelatococcus asaccharovorans]CAH1691425.1 hypothetical protein CHELA40_50147 [Chelatococcus asaccharovorans]
MLMVAHPYENWGGGFDKPPRHPCQAHIRTCLLRFAVWSRADRVVERFDDRFLERFPAISSAVR